RTRRGPARPLRAGVGASPPGAPGVHARAGPPLAPPARAAPGEPGRRGEPRTDRARQDGHRTPPAVAHGWRRTGPPAPRLPDLDRLPAFRSPDPEPAVPGGHLRPRRLRGIPRVVRGDGQEGRRAESIAHTGPARPVRKAYPRLGPRAEPGLRARVGGLL